MKIQLNGFDIEINTDEANMSIKVLDANGKELSNNTYSQSSEIEDEIKKTDMPSANDVAQNTKETETETEENETEENETEETLENFIPDFETFKKLKK